MRYSVLFYPFLFYSIFFFLVSNLVMVVTMITRLLSGLIHPIKWVLLKFHDFGTACMTTDEKGCVNKNLPSHPYMWWPKFSNQEIYQIWSGVLIPYQEVFYRTILMRVKIYFKVKLQFHCPLYHIYPKYSDTASIVDQDQTDHKDCFRSALFASAFIKHSLIPQKNLFKFENGKSINLQKL